MAAYQAAITGGIALGSWMWGSIANGIGVEGALLISGAALVASPLLGLWMRMPTVSGPNELSLDVLADPEVRLSLTPRSGPIVIEIEYRVDRAIARLFYSVMQHGQRSRQRGHDPEPDRLMNDVVGSLHRFRPAASIDRKA